MTIYLLHLDPHEVVRLVRAETETAGGQPELYLSAWEDYLVEEEFDRRAYGLDDDRYNLVTIEAQLDIEPRVEQNYWVLSVTVHKAFGPKIIDEENALIGLDLTLDEFDEGFLATGDGVAHVRLVTQTPHAREHFDQWWAELGQRHRDAGPETPASRPEAPAPEDAGDELQEVAKLPPLKGRSTYRVREAVGVFDDPDALEAAVDELEEAGFDRAAFSVLGGPDDIKERIGHLYRTVAEIEDEGRTPQAAFVSKDERVEAETVAVGVPLYVGGLASAAAVVASGGALAVAIAATVAGGAVGAGVGALLAHAVGRHHAKRIEDQLGHGGLVLWVAVAPGDAEKRALGVLEKCGARHVHVHQIRRRWGLQDRPLSDVQFDPFLFERDSYE